MSCYSFTPIRHMVAILLWESPNLSFETISFLFWIHAFVESVKTRWAHNKYCSYNALKRYLRRWDSVGKTEKNLRNISKNLKHIHYEIIENNNINILPKLSRNCNWEWSIYSMRKWNWRWTFILMGTESPAVLFAGNFRIVKVCTFGEDCVWYFVIWTSTRVLSSWNHSKLKC